MALSLPSGGQAAEPGVLRIGVHDDPQVSGPTEQVLREAYARAGQQQLEFVPLPLRRAALMLRQGELDGDFMRTLAFFEANPSLLRVKVPMRTVVFWAHGRPPCPRALGPDEMAKGRVAYQTGTVILEATLPSGVLLGSATPGDALERVRGGSATFSLLAMTPAMVSAVETRFPELCRVRLPWMTVDLYHALAPQQARLVPALEAALSSMRRDGSLDRLWNVGELELAQWLPSPGPRRPRAAPG